MTDNKNSFETVELIKPVSLMEIDGSDLTDVRAEAKAAEKSAQVPAEEAGKFAADTALANNNTNADNYTDVVNPADHSLEQNIHGKHTGNSDQNPQKIMVDPKKLFGNTPASGEKQDYQKRNYAARFIIICVIGLFLLFTVITVRSFFNDKVEQTGSYSNYNTMLVAPVYTEIEFDADKLDMDLPVIISHKCIEYTDSYNRILFFSATPTEENTGLLIRVEMLDRHGHSLGTHANSNFGIAKGNEYMIPVFFPMSPDWDLDGVTYKIEAETFTEKEHDMLRTIKDVTEADKGHFFITYESSAYYNMDTHVVLYKNGKVVDVLRGYGDVDETGKAVAELYKGGVDYDYYKVFY